ncbi:hypothetical protein HDZ31DRAFT_13807, partial [Schizophyllum fasciatum]
ETPPSDLRSWQIPRRLYGRHVLGWLPTENVCRDICQRDCPLPDHEDGEIDDMQFHLRFLGEMLGLFIAKKHHLPCRGSEMVFTGRGDRTLDWAVVVADNRGLAVWPRSLPQPETVDKIKEYLRIEEEPRWYQSFD